MSQIDPACCTWRIDRFLAWLAFMLAAAIVIGCILMRDADAQTVKIVRLCAPLPDLLDGLRRAHDEVPLFYGRNDRHAFVITRAPKGSWSLVEIGPGGEPVCLIDGGGDSKDARGMPT